MYGVPGLLTTDKKCDFSLGELIQHADTSQTYLVYDKFQNNEGRYDFANLQYEGTHLRNLSEKYEISGETINTASDGSLTKDSGSCAFMMFDDNEMEEPHIYGGGKEEYSELVEQCLTKVHAKKFSSTRMEALALLGLMVAVRYFDPDHLPGFLHLFDSETTINTYKKLRKLNTTPETSKLGCVDDDQRV
jgi:hypothetical protein